MFQRNDEELAKVSGGFANVFTTTRKCDGVGARPLWASRKYSLITFLLCPLAGLGYLKRYAMTPEGQAHKSFYDQRIAAISGLYALLNGQASDEVKQSSFSATTALWDAIKAFTVETLPAAIAEGPFIGGDRPGVDDFHVGAWLARIASVLGAQNSDAGVSVLEKAFGPLPEKVKVFWSAWIVRDSWVKTYPDNVLH
jgi:hypothetical protein